MYRFYFKLFTFFLIALFPFLFIGCAIEPKKTVPEKYKLGQIRFHKVCAQCHGADAMGGKRAPNFLQKKFIPKNFSNARIARTIINGSDSGAMPSQKKRVTDNEIGEIIQYIRYSQKEAGIIS